MVKTKALGKGLSALMGDNNLNQPFISLGEVQKFHINIDAIEQNILQPRKVFTTEGLKELSESIAKNGVLSPILVRPINGVTGKYQIVAGERRWRASKMAGLDKIPAIIKEIDEKEAFEIAIIENIQREDLNPLEEAEGYQRLIKEFSYTQEKLATNLGKSRSHIANMLRLLTLPDSTKNLLQEGKITIGHARALINSENIEELEQYLLNNNLSVRELEQLVREKKPHKNTPNKAPKKNSDDFSEIDNDLQSLEENISSNLGIKVRIENSDRGGKVTLFFDSLEQLDTILQRLN